MFNYQEQNDSLLNAYARTFMLKLEVRWQAPYIISLRKGTGQTLLYFSLKEHTSLNGEKTADQTEGIDQSPKL